MYQKIVFLLSTDFFWKKSFFIYLPFLMCVLSQTSFSQNTPPQDSPQVVALELNKPIEREIKGEEKHSYQVALAADQYLLIMIEQRGIDVVARLSGADGKQLVSFDTEARPKNGLEKIEFAAKTNGIYRIDVQAIYKLLPAGKYEIRLSEIRPATEANQALLEARTLFAESVRMYNSGKYAEAREIIERVIEKRQQTVGFENPSTLIAMSHLARILNVQGKPEEAIEINRRVLAVREKILDADHPDIAVSLNYIASNYRIQEDFPNAILYYERAGAIWEKSLGRSHPNVAANLISLAGAYADFGDKIKAIEISQQALAILENSVGKESVNVAVVLNNLGSNYVNLKEYEKAEAFTLRSIAIFEKLYAPDHPRLLEALSILAFVYEGKSELDKAESLYLRILKGREKSIGADHPFNAYTLNSLAGIYSLKGDFEKSESFYRRALEISEKSLGPDNPGIVGAILGGLSLMLAQKGDVEQAIKIQQRASQIDERNISLNLAIGSERQKLAYIENLSYRTNQNIFLQTRFASENQEAIELAAVTILRQKGRVMDAVSNNIIELRRRLDEKDKSFLDKLNGVTTELSELILSGPEAATLAEHQAKIKNLTDEREKLEDEISRRVAGFYAKSEAVTVSAVQSLIPQNSALIEFAVYTPAESELAVNLRKSSNEPRYVAYIIPHKGQIKWKDIGQTDEIDLIINELRQAVRDPKSKEVQKFARKMDEKLMQPIRTLTGDATQLLISPDGALNLIPFEALIDEKGKYLIENYAFTYLTSGRDLLRMQTARENKNKSLIIANPAFGESLSVENVSDKSSGRGKKPIKRTVGRNLSDTYFVPLRGTTREASAIQTMFPAATLLSGVQATETALEQIDAPRILHIATHGFFLENTDELNSATNSANGGLKANADSKNPLLRSGLALAGANRRDGAKDDGILTALEASGLNLWGTKLVVLSACDTGIGDVKNGEGVYGLRRAFVLAGTETLVMSLWSVSDEATRELMTNYYKNLKNGTGRGESLRQTKLEMLKKKGREHPFFWAAFIQSGEWANLDGKR